MHLTGKRIPARRLEVVARAEEFADAREPPLRFGDIVFLNSGGPASLVVDIAAGESITIAYRERNGRIAEATLPSACMHRMRNLI
jgi:hypothetical protein